ncbi:hypothetical protein GQ53DRAFT_839020 [Thozetella sp. PMI_491]|nr:hypothetical protein GQ53DRAFT_839020 [Thozetella sp. PMI_491]
MALGSGLFHGPKALRWIWVVFIAANSALAAWFLFGNPSLSSFVQPMSQLLGSSIAKEPSSKSTPHDKIAVLVETRMLDNLVPLLLHFSAVLGSSWHVTLFTLESVWTMPPSARFRRAVEENRVSVQFLPPETKLSEWKHVNFFLTRPWLWEQVQSASRILFFQTDSIICSNSNMTVDDFLEWDFVGAPLNPFFGKGLNGGLSIRNPKMILDILASPSNDFDENWKANRKELCIEDQWYYNKTREFGGKLPDVEVARQFAVESLWYDQPLGFHAPRLWNAERMDVIQKYCPEVGLINQDHKVLAVNETDLEAMGPLDAD